MSHLPPDGGMGSAVVAIDATPAPDTTGSQALVRQDVVGGGGFPTQPIAPAPIRTVVMPLERAAMLADLPRKKWNEKTWAAFWASLAALPSAADAFWSAFKISPFSLGPFPSFQIVLFIGFFVWFIVERNNNKNTKTSAEYLRELYSLPSAATPLKKGWQFWR